MKNVILLTLDACRKDVFGCYGGKPGLTPFFDSLRDKLLVFTRAQAAGPYTQASFPGILTSSYYLDFGWQQRCPSQRVFLSEVLKKNGVATAAFHSNPYLSSYFGWNRGWDHFMDSMKDPVTPAVPFLKGRTINERAAAWLSSRKEKGDSRPFFLWVHYMDTHEPYVPEKKFLELVDPSLGLSDGEMFSLFKEVLLKRDTSDGEKVSLLKKLYHAHVREVDGYAQELFATLGSMGFLTDTVVIVTSDHGDEFGEHGGLSHDDKLYSELIDIPLLIYDPERKTGEGCSGLVSNIDIPPTVAQLFGLERMPAFQGESLLPIDSFTRKGCFGEALFQVKGKGGDIGKDVYYYRQDDLKIIYRASQDAWEMYDLRVDPLETDNIVGDSADAEAMKSQLRPRVRRWEKK
jgi:arylsulfatase A-like enzyme